MAVRGPEGEVGRLIQTGETEEDYARVKPSNWGQKWGAETQGAQGKPGRPEWDVGLGAPETPEGKSQERSLQEGAGNLNSPAENMSRCEKSLGLRGT